MSVDGYLDLALKNAHNQSEPPEVLAGMHSVDTCILTFNFINTTLTMTTMSVLLVALWIPSPVAKMQEWPHLPVLPLQRIARLY